MSVSAASHRVGVLTACVGLLVILVLGVAGGAATIPHGPQSPPQIVTTTNTSNYVMPSSDGTVREEIDHQQVNAGVAVATDAQTLAGRFDRLVLADQLRDANESARIGHLRAQVQRLENRTARLRAARTAARSAFREGRLSADAYLSRVTLLEAATERASARREQLASQVRPLRRQAGQLPTRLGNLEADFETLEGPVLDRVASRYLGTDASGGTLVRVTSSGGYVHATATNGTLYREAQTANDWNRGGSVEFEDEGAGNRRAAPKRASELYSWAYGEGAYGRPTPRGRFGSTVLFKNVVAHTQGKLTVFIDGSTESVFREVQEKQHGAVDPSWRRTARANGLGLTVEGTHPTGSLGVQVTRAGTEAEVDSRVAVDGTFVGSTGVDGRLVTLQPTGDFTVNATRGSDSVTLNVSVAET